MKGRPSPQSLVENIEGLPTLPSVVARVNQLVQDPNASAADLNEILSNDLALSSRLLKLANSSYYGFPSKISSVTHAVVVLGFNTVRNVVFSAFVVDAFDARDLPFGYREFWIHSIATAVATGNLLRPFGRKASDDGFICGLLHDIGKVVLHQFAREEFLRILQTVRETGCLIREAEEQILGFTHEDVGRALLEAWNIPPRIRDVVSDHHRLQSQDETLTGAAAVHVADIFARAALMGSGGDNTIPVISDKAAGTLGLTPENIGAKMEGAAAEMQRAEGFLELL